MQELAAAAKSPARVYLLGGASAVLLGWRDATIDVDLKLVPESDETLRALPRLKDQLKINIELASPDDFIPPLPDWQDRSQFIRQEGKLAFYHYDFYAQALAKIERDFEIDRDDVQKFFASGLVEPDRLSQLFEVIQADAHRYPELNFESFGRSVERVVRAAKQSKDASA